MSYKVFVLVAVEVIVVEHSLRNVLQELVELAAADVPQMRKRGFCVEGDVLWKKSYGSLAISLRRTSSNFYSASSSWREYFQLLLLVKMSSLRMGVRLSLWLPCRKSVTQRPQL